MGIIGYILLSFITGVAIGWFLSNLRSAKKIYASQLLAQQQKSDLEKSFAEYASKTTEQIKNREDLLADNKRTNLFQEEVITQHIAEIKKLNNDLSISNAELSAKKESIIEKDGSLVDAKKELTVLKEDHIRTANELASERAINSSLQDKLDTQKYEIETLNKKFQLEFENVASKILDIKSEKFTALNKDNLTQILEPLGKNITEFKSKVEEVYNKESKERFSLEERVKELAQLNKVISEEAHNLTRALKNESKIQGGWGEMILENILEKSGLVKNREYFLQHELRDENGNPLRSDEEGKKMRPDAVVKYPDNRNVIIDSKVSLNAFTRCIEAIDEGIRSNELHEHLSCIRKHINSLSARGYDDYDKSLDFVVMFIPSEPAYIAALQIDPNLWEYAYNKRILLLSPTNLITSLKLIVDLWKREYQNQNALAIAERGAKLYDKFVGFVENLNSVGVHLAKAEEKYEEAFKRLSTGNDNLITQATKLKLLGLKTKKDLPKDIMTMSISVDQLETDA
jgi:DNA recombination protein RmuC